MIRYFRDKALVDFTLLEPYGNSTVIAYPCGETPWIATWKDKISTSRSKAMHMKDCEHVSVDASLTSYASGPTYLPNYFSALRISANFARVRMQGKWVIWHNTYTELPDGRWIGSFERESILFSFELTPNASSYLCFHWCKDDHNMLCAGTYFYGTWDNLEYEVSNFLRYRSADTPVRYRPWVRMVGESMVQSYTNSFEKYEVEAIWNNFAYRSFEPLPLRHWWNDINLPLETFGGLTTEAVNSARCVDINLPAYFSDLSSTFGDLRSGLETIRAIFKKDYAALRSSARGLSKLDAAKIVSSQYLGTRYGTRLTLNDTYELSRGVVEWARKVYPDLARSYNRCQAEDRQELPSDNLPPFVTRMYAHRRVQINYRDVDDEVLKCFKQIYDLGVLPNLDDAWDVVPYSFVVNWFLPIDSFLTTLQAKTMSQYLNVLGVISTQKKVVEYDGLRINGIGTGHVSCTYYSRTISKELDCSCPDLGTGPQFLNHIPELSAILVQQF